ncbi:MAG TPA: aminotransferase class V-fold PLP-dependent enzyme, partial [Candidatus Korarchaeota archaeon]|nr:aminotransferase class V-fold PLP-dependent enzyme [Candidatus Korarchaeota archaeon]
MLDVGKIREDFPILRREIAGRPVIYFDNAATTQKPRQVIEAILRFYEEHNANVHRGLHTLSQEASELYEEAHEVVAKFIGASGMEEVAFTAGTTDSLNQIAEGWACRHLRPGDRIVSTVMEHHSNMLPWRLAAARVGAEIVYVDVTEDGLIKWEQLENAISYRTRVVAITGMSNVTGTIVDVAEVAKLAHEVDAVLVVDGAQAVPHMPIDVRSMRIDFLAFSGHKMLGPTGIGVLYGRKDLLEEMEPTRVGGGMISDVTLEGAEWAELPWRLEAGTPHIAGGVGLAEAVRYLQKIGMENVRDHERRLT